MQTNINWTLEYKMIGAYFEHYPTIILNSWGETWTTQRL